MSGYELLQHSVEHSGCLLLPLFRTAHSLALVKCLATFTQPSQAHMVPLYFAHVQRSHVKDDCSRT